jgi:hypothetical protein
LLWEKMFDYLTLPATEWIWMWKMFEITYFNPMTPPPPQTWAALIHGEMHGCLRHDGRNLLRRCPTTLSMFLLAAPSSTRRLLVVPLQLWNCDFLFLTQVEKKLVFEIRSRRNNLVNWIDLTVWILSTA